MENYDEPLNLRKQRKRGRPPINLRPETTEHSEAANHPFKRGRRSEEETIEQIHHNRLSSQPNLSSYVRTSEERFGTEGNFAQPFSVNLQTHSHSAQTNAPPKTVTPPYVVIENNKLPSCRFNSRAAVHNLPIQTAPTRPRYATYVIQPAVDQIQQMNAQTPVARLQRSQPKHKNMQTEFTMTDEEALLIKAINKMGLNIKQLNVSKMNGEYVVTYNEIRKRRRRRVVGNETINTIMMQSDKHKDAITNWLTSCYQRMPPVLPMLMPPQKPTQKNVPANEGLNTTPVFPAPSEQTVNALNGAANAAEIANQISQQRNMSPPGFQGCAIPTLFNYFNFPRSNDLSDVISGQNMNPFDLFNASLFGGPNSMMDADPHGWY